MTKEQRFSTLWRNKWLTSDDTTLEGMEASLRGAADTLKEYREAGLQLDAQGNGEDYMYIFTHDQKLAERFELDPDELDEDEDDDFEEGEDDPEEE
jgi:hypothetical protein